MDLLDNSISWFILVESVLALSIGLLWGTYEWARKQSKDKLLVFMPSWFIRQDKLKGRALPLKRLYFFLVILTLLTTLGAAELIWLTYYYFWPPLKETPLMIIPLSILPIELLLYYYFLIKLINLVRRNKLNIEN